MMYAALRAHNDSVAALLPVDLRTGKGDLGIFRNMVVTMVLLVLDFVMRGGSEELLSVMTPRRPCSEAGCPSRSGSRMDMRRPTTSSGVRVWFLLVV